MNPSAGAVLLIFGISGIIAFIAAIYFAYENISSQTIVLSVAAFSGAFVLLSIQFFLELKGESDSYVFTGEYTLDRKLPQMASAFYSDSHPGTLRGTTELETSDKVARKTPKTFKDIPPHILAMDMAVSSFMAMLLGYQPDWQGKPRVLNARYTFGMQSFMRVSTDTDCTVLSPTELKRQLESSGNVFADLDLTILGASGVCLPRHSKVFTTRTSVTLSNPWCKVVLTVQEPNSFLPGRPELIQAGKPRTIQDEKLPDGTSRFTNMLVPIDVRIDYHALYSKHREMKKVREWTSQLIPAIQAWYEGTGNKFVQFKSHLEK